MIIATKVWGPMDKNDLNARGLSRHHIVGAVEQSLQRLQTDYIDLYQVTTIIQIYKFIFFLFRMTVKIAVLLLPPPELGGC